MTPGGDRAIVVDSDYENKFPENTAVVNPSLFYERRPSLDIAIDELANADVTVTIKVQKLTKNGCCRDCMKAFSATGKVSLWCLSCANCYVGLSVPGAAPTSPDPPATAGVQVLPVHGLQPRRQPQQQQQQRKQKRPLDKEFFSRQAAALCGI
jgi:hypothetical protein